MAYCVGHARVGVTHNPSSDAKSEDRGLESATESPAPGTPATLKMRHQSRRPEMQLPFLSLDSYYNFISTALIVLFVVGLVIVFVYEYEALRRSKT